MTAMQSASFAELLKQYRVAASLTQEALAERGRLSARTISDLERGIYRAPQRETLQLLATALDLGAPEREALAAAAQRGREPLMPRGRPHPAVAASVPTAQELASPSNLPIQPTPLLGRADELAAVRGFLARADVRLLTLTGPGGVGKTRLALDAASDLGDRYPDGVYLVALAPIHDPALVASAIGQTLGLREDGGQPMADRLRAYLRDRRALLLLDNFEHVAAAVPLVADLLSACPGLGMLVTSRAALRVRGERELPVPPLALPDLEPSSTPRALLQSPAVALFVERAQAVKPSFALTDANAAAVAALVTRLDGLPLAIELAAAWVKLFAPRELLARLERAHGDMTPPAATATATAGREPALSMLVGGSHDLPRRLRTMSDTIAWSYDILDAEERTLFRRLAVFAGGCTLEAAEHVCTASGHDAIDVLRGLAALVDKSLLRSEEDLAGESRVGMLETVRAYALERLVASGEHEALRRAHAAYYLALAEAAEPELHGPTQTMWLARLEREHDNLRAALRWTMRSAEVELGLRLVVALRIFWHVRGYTREGRDWLGLLLAASADAAGAGELALLRARAFHGAGALAFYQGDYATATAQLEDGLALYRGLGDERGSAAVLNALGLAAIERGDRARGTVLFEESLASWRATGDAWGIAGALDNLAMLASERGDDARASALHEEALPLFQQVGDTANIAVTLSNMADVARARGDHGRAMALYGESMTLFRDTGDKLSAAYSLQGVASVLAAMGRARQAAQLISAATALRAAIGAPLPPSDRADYEQTVDMARRALGAETFAALWANGEGLTFERATAAALAAIEDGSVPIQDRG